MKNRSLLLLSMLVLPTSQLLAWGAIGHQTTAELAERLLDENGRNLVAQTLAEPMAFSSVFPDQVKSDARYSGNSEDFSAYHYINVSGDVPKTDSMKFSPKPQDMEQRNADLYLRMGRQMILDALKRNDVHMARHFMRYTIHIVGDLHQPLHVGHSEDRGGTLCYVKWRNPLHGQIEEKHLHGVIDDEIFEYARRDFLQAHGGSSARQPWFGYQELSDMLAEQVLNIKIDRSALMKKHHGQQAKVAEALIQIFSDQKTKDWQAIAQTPYQEWYQESYALHARIYPDELWHKQFPQAKVVKPLTHRTRPYCRSIEQDQNQKVTERAHDATKLPLLEEDYARPLLNMAYQSLWKGALRLAHHINELAAEAKKQGSLDTKAHAQYTKSLKEAQLRPTP